MKYLKKFELFEAVIIPSKIEDNATVNSFQSAYEFGQRNGFDVVNYDEFYNSLGEGDKKTAPPRQGVPFFALFHPERKRPMFVLVDENAARFIPNFKDIMLDIIGHERVHAEQTIRRGDIEFHLPNPMDRKAYFSNKEEIMAFSFTIANELSRVVRTATEGMEKLQRGIGGQAGHLWSDIKKYCDEKTIKRYTKYIYMYLDKIFNKEEESPVM